MDADRIMKTLTALSDLRPHVTHPDIACSRFDRRGRTSVARLVEQHGAGAALREVIGRINADCPKVAAQGVMDRCDVHFPGLDRLLR